MFVPRDGRAIPNELATLLNGRANPNDPYQLVYYLDFQDRESEVDVMTYSMIAGFEGSIPGSDWTWEAFVSQGESETHVAADRVCLARTAAGSGFCTQLGRGFREHRQRAFGGFGASTARCTSGLNPFDFDQSVSQDCIEAISADIKTRSVMAQSIWEVNAQGSLFELPAGALQAAVGASHRTNEFEFINDTLTTQGRSFLDQAVGLFPSGNSSGEIRVGEVYGELLVPILADTFVQGFNLELGARYSDYNTTGGVWTYKILGDLELNDWLRFRGGYNRAVRAPNIAELFLAPQQTFAFSAGGDPCSVNNTLAWSANPVSNPTNFAGVRALCTQIMNQFDTGAQNTAARFYGNPQRRPWAEPSPSRRCAAIRMCSRKPQTHGRRGW